MHPAPPVSVPSTVYGIPGIIARPKYHTQLAKSSFDPILVGRSHTHSSSVFFIFVSLLNVVCLCCVHARHFALPISLDSVLFPSSPTSFYVNVVFAVRHCAAITFTSIVHKQLQIRFILFPKTLLSSFCLPRLKYFVEIIVLSCC